MEISPYRFYGSTLGAFSRNFLKEDAMFFVNYLKISKNQIVYWLTLLMCAAISGCGEAGKPDIKSECNIKGNGDYHCTYNNKGTAKGSLCEYIILKKYASDAILRSYKYNDYEVSIETMKESGKFSIPQDAAWKDFYTAWSIWGRSGIYKGREPGEDVMDTEETAIWKKTSDSNRTLIKELDNKIRTVLSSIQNELIDDIGYSSNEVCSGIVEAGDVREINGFAEFNGMSPSGFCRNWPQDCVMTTIPSSALEATKKESISPSLSQAIRIDKIKAAIGALPTK